MAQSPNVYLDKDSPTDQKAQKTYRNAQENVHRHALGLALDEFKKADKQDGGHCVGCHKQMVQYGMELQDWKTAETASEELIAEAHDKVGVAIAHYQLGVVFMREGIANQKNELFTRAHDELSKALATEAKFPGALYPDGISLAHLKQDADAKSRFEEFVKLRCGDDPDRQRALRYVNNPELARARMAPPFAITTIDGQRVSLDDLKGKVVLIDFWATWCPSCREALPHVREIAKKFRGEPFVVISVSLDEDERKWKDFVTKNEMTWLQYRDSGFQGPVAELFAVKVIPQTFTIDANGILQDQHIGDASIEGKLKKLLAEARDIQTRELRAQ